MSQSNRVYSEESQHCSTEYVYSCFGNKARTSLQLGRWKHGGDFSWPGTSEEGRAKSTSRLASSAQVFPPCFRCCPQPRATCLESLPEAEVAKEPALFNSVDCSSGCWHCWEDWQRLYTVWKLFGRALMGVLLSLYFPFLYFHVCLFFCLKDRLVEFSSTLTM